MGAAISAIKHMVEEADDAKGKEKEIKEAIENMRVMAQDQLSMFNERIRFVTQLCPPHHQDRI